jgi:hypothetical protein
MCSSENGAKMCRYESFEEAIGGLAASPDLHSAGEVIDRLAHHACKIASARSEVLRAVMVVDR